MPDSCGLDFSIRGYGLLSQIAKCHFYASDKIMEQGARRLKLIQGARLASDTIIRMRYEGRMTIGLNILNLGAAKDGI